MQNQQRIDAEAQFFEGNRHMAAGNFDAAENCFRQAIRLAPDLSEAYGNLGFVMDHQGDVVQAEDCYRQSLALDPGSSTLHLNLGALLASQKRFKQAQAAYEEAIFHEPQSPAAWSNLGALFAGMKREEEAESCLRKAIQLDGSYAKAHFNLSYLLLRQGRFEEGLRSLEARDWYTALANYLACPRWQGESLVGKSLLIGYEAGHGDMIQFCRYAKALKAQGAGRITLLCHPALKTLLMTLDSVDAVMAYDENIPKSGWDFWTPLMSIPYYCQTRAENIPAEIPYLQANAGLMPKWRDALPDASLRVGLVWKGNPKFENDADRSLASLDLLAPLGAVKQACFISLQKGEGEDEALRPPTGLSLLALGSQMTDFADAAAIVAQLDLVICVDTAMAHLTAALGKPCWLLLPDYMTDWRWGSEGAGSLWYPGVMRIFRQSQPGDWNAVVNDVVAALQEFATARLSSTS
ncbi:MAG: tetratricopeptide repeat protein [Rhodoferax sp.]|uniref:tetratricopeptide repeat-containing glycosyltransferase family protein n=1 Tax=Rhodoferax sp. TaxID=50421 RepID=UPI0030170B7D